jgi:starch synthase
VLETVKKLGWAPDVIHCHGWFSGLVPIYAKKSYKDNPLFTDSKVVVSIYNEVFEEKFNKEFAKKIKYDGINVKDLAYLKDPNYVNLMKLAVDYADGVVYGDETINPELQSYVKKSGKPILEYQDMETYQDAYSEFYDKILVEESVASR